MPLPKTQAEVDAHNARVAAGRQRRKGPAASQEAIPEALTPSTGPGDPPESALHEEIRQFCIANGWPAMHGSMAHRAYRVAGEPDFIIAAPNGVVLWVECKTKTGKLTREQAGMLAWLQRLGHRATVVRSFQEFLEFVTGSNRMPEHVRD